VQVYFKCKKSEKFAKMNIITSVFSWDAKKKKRKRRLTFVWALEHVWQKKKGERRVNFVCTQ